MDLTAVVALAAKTAAVPPALLLSICFTETGLKNVISPADGQSASYGICQMKLATARRFNKSVRPSDLLNPLENAKYAALYLRHQLRRYKGNTAHAVAAYNAGCARFDNSGALRNTKYISKVFSALERTPWKR